MVLILWKNALKQIPIILKCAMSLELLEVDWVVKDGPVEVPEDVEENRVENLKEEKVERKRENVKVKRKRENVKVKRKRENVKGNVQRKDVENVVVNYI